MEERDDLAPEEADWRAGLDRMDRSIETERKLQRLLRLLYAAMPQDAKAAVRRRFATLLAALTEEIPVAPSGRRARRTAVAATIRCFRQP